MAKKETEESDAGGGKPGMKKWIIILIAIILAGATSSGAIAGHIYYKEMKTYEDYDKKELQVNGIENIFIDSDVPVNIKATQGPAYVEFNQRFTDVIGKAPTYKLEVETKESIAYITLKQKSKVDLCLPVIKENKAFCTVYLPPMTINKLSLEGPLNYSWDWDQLEDADFDFKDINIKELVVNIGSRGDIYLDGNYEKVDINMGEGKLEMNSKLPSDVKIDGDMACKFTGVYNKINVQGHREISVDSKTPAEVSIEGNGNIMLNGSYKQIDIKGPGSPDIAIKSDTLCEANVYTDQGNVKIQGAIQAMTVKTENFGQVDINTTVIPKRINILGNCNDVKLMLPSNIPGIEVTYNNDYFKEQNNNGYRENDSQENYSGEQQQIISDYKMKKNLTEDNVTREIYRDASTKILLEASVDNSIYILDNGYISHTAGAQETVKKQSK